MKSQETLSKIMELLNLQDEVKLESMKLENGTTIEAEAFESNQEVFIVTEDERIALPVGEYELEDGRILVVAEEGIIAEVRDAAAEEAPAEEAPEEAPAEEVEANEEEKEEMGYATKEELSAAVAEMKEMIEEIKAMMSPKEMSEEPKEELAEEVKEEVEMSADEPAAKPIKHNPETKTADMHKFSKGARKDTLSRIFDKLN